MKKRFPSQEPLQMRQRRQTARLSRRVQQQFLDQCIKGERSLDAIMADLHVEPRTLARWLASGSFRRRLDGVRAFLTRTRELDVELAARAGARRLAVANNADPKDKERNVPETSRRAIVDLIRLARDTFARRSQELRDARLPRGPAVHPDVDPATARELIEALER